MKKNKKTLMLLVLIGVVALSVGTYAYYEYNRKAINVADANIDFTLSSKDLIQQLTNKPQLFDSIYHSKILEVIGAVKNIDTDENGFHTVVIGDSASSSSIRCSLDSVQDTKFKELGQLKIITVKGIYTGFNADDLGIGSDVILSRCVIEKN